MSPTRASTSAFASSTAPVVGADEPVVRLVGALSTANSSPSSPPAPPPAAASPLAPPAAPAPSRADAKALSYKASSSASPYARPRRRGAELIGRPPRVASSSRSSPGAGGPGRGEA